MDGSLASWPRLPVLVALLLSSLVAILFPWLRRIGIRNVQRLEGNGGARLSNVFAADGPIWSLAAGLLIAAALAIVTSTHGSYGYNVDEWVQSQHAEAIADWYVEVLSSGELRAFIPRPQHMQNYGGFFELPAELLCRILPWDRTATRHLVTAWFGVLGLLGAYLLGSSLHGRATGFLTALLLLLTPRFYGHFFSNPKDLPFAVCMIFSLLAICRVLPDLPRLRVRSVLLVGAAIGAGMGVRIGGVIALLYFGLAVLWWLAGQILRGRASGGAPAARDLLRLVGGVVGVVSTAWVVMLASWSWALGAPLQRPIQALGYFQDIVGRLQIDFPVFFDGGIYRLSTIPRYYTVKWLLISSPEIWLLAPVVGVVLVQWLRRRGLSWPSSREMAWILVVASILLPLATTASHGVIQYDGIRHFLFVLPPLTLILAASLVEMLTGPLSLRLKAGLLVGVISLSSVTLFDMWKLHPYEYVYFNRSAAGGLSGAAQRFETDYLGLSYREGVRWVLANYGAPSGARRAGPTRIAACDGFHPNLIDALELDPQRAERFKAVGPYDDPEIIVAFTRTNCHRRFRGRVLQTFGRAGTPLLYVIQLRKKGG